MPPSAADNESGAVATIARGEGALEVLSGGYAFRLYLNYERLSHLLNDHARALTISLRGSNNGSNNGNSYDKDQLSKSKRFIITSPPKVMVFLCQPICLFSLGAHHYFW